VTEKILRTYQLDGRTISYFVIRSRKAGNYRITYLDKATFRIAVPRGRSTPDPEDLLSRHRRWISNRLRDERKRRIPQLKLKDGGSIPLLGAAWTLKIQTAGALKPSWIYQPEDQTLCLSTRDPSEIPKILEFWYRHMAKDFLTHRLPYWTGRMKVSPAGFRIKNQRTIWGSCSHRSLLNFNWRIMILSPEAADYLIIHELAHLKHLNHSALFWRMVERFCPDYKTKRKEIKNKNHWLLFGRTENTALKADGD
jgi:predicted metal-dependent hydrolase